MNFEISADCLVMRWVSIILVTGLIPALCNAADDVSEIEAQWRQRQQLVQSASFKWTSKTTQGDAYRRLVRESKGEKKLPTNSDVPIKQFVQEDPENWFRLDGSRVSLTSSILDVTAKESGRTPDRYRSAFDGISSRSYTPARAGTVGRD